MLDKDNKYYVLKCDGCGRTSRIFKNNFNKDIAKLCEHNDLYCQYCSSLYRNPNKIGVKFVMGMTWVVEKPHGKVEPTPMDKARDMLDQTLVYSKGGLPVGNMH